MPLIDTNHQRAALLVLLLGVALVIAVTPYATGLIGIPVLYAVFTPVHEWLSLRVRPKLAASLVVALALFLIVVPGVSFAGLIVGQAQEIAGGVIRNPLLGRLRELKLGGVDLGPRLVRIRVGGHRDAGGPQPHDFLIRPVLPAATAAGDVGRGAAVHPLFGEEHGKAAAAVPRRDERHDHRHRPDRGRSGLVGRARILAHGSAERGVLGRRDDGVRHSAGGRERPGVGAGSARPHPERALGPGAVAPLVGGGGGGQRGLRDSAQDLQTLGQY